ncbi:hypothetical protein BT96DRAFT_1043524 [Gymnopus androsaceus JB14]|uniref:Uncharacterized protein n=1 Tax=Gymnopus androsaceus JB14 TaxID=1447944 RepID=A0A6A4HEL0_9AGAR|nr:hypothetical protein BT96DRAFT_1043524 [Gymnopus androsaceus JB14]
MILMTKKVLFSLRDLFKPSSSKDQLHTLVEEEEEEEESPIVSQHAVDDDTGSQEGVECMTVFMSSGSGSCPILMAFSVVDSKVSSASEPSNEMLRLVTDPKPEHDELKCDVDGWRVCVSDLEAQILLLVRIEGEKREAWVARLKMGLLEVEKGALERELAQVQDELRERDREMDELMEENERLGREWKREVERLRVAEKSSTEVKEIDFGLFDNGYPLKAVEEEEQLDKDLLNSLQIPQEDIEEDYLSLEEDKDNGLAGYEDEDEDLDKELDLDLINTPSTLTLGSHSPSASSAPMDAFKLPCVAPAPTHRVIGSLLKTWTFPAATSQQNQTPPSQSRDCNEVDMFSNCLKDSESNFSTAGLRSPVLPYTYNSEHNNSEHNKGYSLSAKVLEAFDEDDIMPFSLLPGVLGAIGQEEQESPRSLDVAFKEEEEEEGEEKTRVDDDQEDDDDIYPASRVPPALDNHPSGPPDDLHSHPTVYTVAALNNATHKIWPYLAQFLISSLGLSCGLKLSYL